MSILATICWLLTAGVGSFMVVIWRRHGGMSAGDPAATHLPPARVFSHLGVAVVGLVLWLIFLGTSSSGWAWVALLLAAAAAVLGSLMVRIWAADGRLSMNERDTSLSALAEQHIPRLPVLLHGGLAVVTLVLVLLVALGV